MMTRRLSPARWCGLAALVAAWFLLALGWAFRAIRSGQVARHREWMIRAFAVAIGISSVRVCGAIVDLALTPAGFRPQELFVGSLWTGWAVTIYAAEIWIRRTRRGGASGQFVHNPLVFASSDRNPNY